jgi:hypothetical protein
LDGQLIHVRPDTTVQSAGMAVKFCVSMISSLLVAGSYRSWMLWFALSPPVTTSRVPS